MIESIVLALSLGVVSLPGLPADPGPTDWPMFQKDLAHSGAARFDQWTGVLQKCVEVTLPAGTDSVPILVGDYIFVHFPGTVQARNRFTGALVWSTLLTPWDENKSSMTYDSGKIYVFGNRGNLFCMDANTGAVLWVEKPGNYPTPKSSSPVIIGQNVYVINGQRDLVALDADDGTELWRINFASGLLGAPVYDEGLLYFGTYNGWVVGVQLDIQTVVFYFDLNPYTCGAITGSPTISDRVLYVGTNLGKVFAIDLDTNSFLWEYAIPDGAAAYIASGLAVQDNTLGFVSDARAIYSLDKRYGTDVCPPKNTEDNYAQMNAIIVEGDVLAAGCTGGTHVMDPDACDINDYQDDDCGNWSSLVSKDGWVYGIDRCGNLDFWCPIAPTVTETPTITHTFTQTLSITPSPTFTPTPSVTPTYTITPTNTITLTFTDTLTITPTPVCEGLPTELRVKVVFDPEVRDDLSIIMYADEPVDCSRTEFVVYPHSYPRDGVTITGSVQVDDRTCEGYFTRERGFGDIAKVFAYVEDNCGNKMGSDGTFEREVIPNKDVIFTHNRIFPGKGTDCVGIHYNIPSPGSVKITVYDLEGRLVKTIIDENAESGQYETSWCGLGESGGLVGSGIYIIVVETEDYTESGKAIVVK